MIGFLEGFRKDLSDGIFGVDALSCSDQEKSIQSLNVIKRGGSVQFSTCYLGIPDLSRGNEPEECRGIGVKEIHTKVTKVRKVTKVFR